MYVCICVKHVCRHVCRNERKAVVLKYIYVCTYSHTRPSKLDQVGQRTMNHDEPLNSPRFALYIHMLIFNMKQKQDRTKGELFISLLALFSWCASSNLTPQIVTHCTASASLVPQIYRTFHHRRSQSTFTLNATPSTSPKSSASKKSKNPLSKSEFHSPSDAKAIERDIARLSRTGRAQDALSLYWSVWEMDDNNVQTTHVKPTTKLMNHAIDACARCRPSPLVSEAFRIFEHAIVGGKTGQRRLCPNVYTFGALMSVCARVGDVQKCSELLISMKV